MKLSQPESWFRFTVGALLALLTVGVVAPGRAEAGCSHFVSWKGSEIEGLGDLSLLRIEGATPSARGQSAPTDSPADPHRKPCTGVFCSGSPAPLVPATDVPPQADDWCLPTGEAPEVRPEPIRRVNDDGRFHPVHTGAGIFHPPRTPLA